MNITNKLKFMIVLSKLQTGGAERVAISYCNWLVQNTTNEVYLLLFEKSVHIYNIDDKVKIINLDIHDESKIKGIYLRYKKIKDVFKKTKPNIIFTMFTKTSIYALLAKSRESVLISSERANIKKRKFFNRFLSRSVSKKCDGFIFQTKRIQALYPGDTIKKSIIIQNAVSNVMTTDISFSKENIITAMGRLTEQKGFDILIQAFHRFDSLIDGYKLIIFGEGPERKKLEKLIDNYGLNDKVLLPGNKSNVLEYIAKSKMFVLSSRFEGMPNALLEAMSTGTACISTNCEFGPSEIIRNTENGILIDVDDIDGLVISMKELALNDNLRKKIEQSARKILITNLSDKIYSNYYNYMKDVYIKKTYHVKDNSRSLYNRFLNKILNCPFSKKISNDIYLKLKFKLKLGRNLNLKNPQTFNEKLQWLKVYDHNPQYTMMVDKYLVRDYVSEKIGEEYLVPLLGVYDSFEEIDFSRLPEKFVIKCNHDSGGLVICRDKNKLDISYACEKINKCLKRNYYYSSREWPYKNVKPKIIIEKFLEDKNNTSIRDYKLFCFNGTPKFFYVSEGLENHQTAKISFLDLNFNFMPFKRSDYKSFDEAPEKPINLDLMIKFAKVLSKGIPHLRVDFYEIDGKLYFGELTFYTCSGFIPFYPEEWDLKLGKKLKLPKRSQYEK